MRDVLGIDPSLTGTGLAWGDGQCTITTTASEPDGVRLERIYDAVQQFGLIQLAVVEDLPGNAHSAGLTGMAQGVVRLALWRVKVPTVTVPPASLKKYATGRGNASKADMRVALYQRTGRDLRDDNQVDAVWLHAIGCDLLGAPSIAVPATHRAALAKLHLPMGVN